MKHFLTILLASLFIFSNAINAQAEETPNADNVIGYLEEVTGEVTLVLASSGESTAAKTDQEISLGDKLMTANDDSRVIATFLDGTSITMSGEMGELIIDKYLYDPNKPEKSGATYSVFHGSIEFVGGFLDKLNPKGVQMNLDFGSIGIRGTTFYRAMKDKECWIYLEEGEIAVFNDGGEVTLKPGDGTRMSSKEVAPMPVHPWSEKEINWIKSEVAPK